MMPPVEWRSRLAAVASPCDGIVGLTALSLLH